MKSFSWRWLVILPLFVTLKTFATVHYVDVNGTNSTVPYTDWTTAATNIQDAIDASTNGDTVLVTNGVYASGGRVMAEGLTNRVALDGAITVQSINGPWVTFIQGAGASLGPSAVRCAWLTNNATLIGFTLQDGATFNGSGDALTWYGGGVWCASGTAVVDNCIIVSNTAYQYGCGVYQGTYNNCLISSNGGVSSQGAAYGAILNSCTIVSNGGALGVFHGSMTNCIVHYNVNNSGIIQNYLSVTSAAYCCTTPLISGTGNFTNAPQLFVDGVRLLSTSPCIGAGTNLVTGTDIFGNAWADPPSVGCAEYYPAPVIAQPSLVLTGNPNGFAVTAPATGALPLSFFWLENGVPLQNDGHFSSTQTTNLIASGLNLADAGNYQLVASNSYGVTTSAVVTLALHCVNGAGSNSVAPYSSWATAATNIQDAITASTNGDIVLVTNGFYSFGSVSMDGISSNRVALTKAIRVQSINGPWVTTIQGGGHTNGASAVRCAWLTNNSILVGFALQAGATQTSGNNLTAQTGGGVWCASSNSFVDNCVIISNTSYSSGVVYQGTLNNCLIRSNGGTAVYSANLNSCTIVSNTPYGVFQGSMTNCIVYSNLLGNCVEVSPAAYCCTTPALTGPGNFTNAPQLQADGVHLIYGSPCIHTGTNTVTGTDIFGQAWANPPSIGCAEYDPVPTAGQPRLALISQPVGFQIGNAAFTGQPPLFFTWLENGVPLQDNGHFSGSQTTNLVAIGVSVADGGNYQLVVSNAFGAVTSGVISLAVHAVDAAGVNPEPPFSTWDTAATNIQDAIEAASAGDFVLVTNGIYDAGGEAEAGNLTNRVALDKALIVVSVNGWSSTIIEGALDPNSTEGPAAVRCAWLTNGAVLSGFTLQNGATQNTGNTTTLQSGGGVWCVSTNGLVSNCLLTNDFAAYGGGGIAYGTLDNSLVVGNVATYGGGAYNATLNNCTVENNYTTLAQSQRGGGTYAGLVRNSIVVGNFDGYPYPFGLDNYAPVLIGYSYSCTQNDDEPFPTGPGNIGVEPQFLDLYHISANSPCRGTGSALYASGTDLDGEVWNTPPSMGCDEFVAANRVGPLSVTVSPNVVIYPPHTNALVNHLAYFVGTISGLATSMAWNFGDGPPITNTDYYLFHQWSNAGNYNVVFTAFNTTYPAGVSTNIAIQVVPVMPAQLLSPTVLSNGFEFQFAAQVEANYTVQYTTNLAPPATWVTFNIIHIALENAYQIQDIPPTNTARFYRVIAQ